MSLPHIRVEEFSFKALSVDTLLVVKLCHTKVRHFSPSCIKHEDIVTGEISIDDTVRMKIGERHGNVVVNAQLSG